MPAADCLWYKKRYPEGMPFVEIRISTSRDRGRNRQVPSAKMPQNLLFSSAEINSACGFHSGNGFVSRTLPLSENHIVYSVKRYPKRIPFFSEKIFSKIAHSSELGGLPVPEEMIFFTFFSNFTRGSMTMCPQPQHLIRKSMPVRKISHWAEPQG